MTTWFLRAVLLPITNSRRAAIIHHKNQEKFTAIHSTTDTNHSTNHKRAYGNFQP